MPEKEYIRGNWLAIRNKAEEALVCDGCRDVIQEGEIYHERYSGQPYLICSLCVENMIMGALDLISEEK